MTEFGVWVRKFKQRFMGYKYCSVYSVHTHDFEYAGRLEGLSGFTVRCKKCEKKAYYCPYLGAFIQLEDL